jgi:regulatory protein
LPQLVYFLSVLIKYMKKITALKMEEGRKKRVAVYWEGQRRPLRLEVDTALKEGLTVGQEFSESELAHLTRLDLFYRTQNAALHFLSYRPRSESEVKSRLIRRGFTESEINAVLLKLKEQGLLSDTDFAEFWKENRQAFSPRSQFLTRLELKRKGVANEVIDEVVSSLDDSTNAYRAGMERARRITIADRNVFRKRLGDYLRRRGFSYGVINETVERIWREVSAYKKIY